MRTNTTYVDSEISEHVAKTYFITFVGVLITGIIGLLGSELYPQLFTSLWALIISAVVMFVMVYKIAKNIKEYSPSQAMRRYLLLCSVMGVFLTAIFVTYSIDSILITFFLTAGLFFIMSMIGYFTKKDLSSWGNVLFFMLLGLIGATLVNIFWANSLLYWITTYAGILIFLGLIIYDSNRIKKDYYQLGEKGAILSALGLYLDFINLFLLLLRLIGGGGSKD